MKQVKKSVLLWYSPHEMYALVTAVEDYPRFLPWCSRAEVIARDENGLTARLHLAYAGVRHAFTTHNTQVLNESVHIGLVDGPFSMLEGMWRFLSLPVTAESEKACKIEFDLQYAFSNGPLEHLISPVFDRIADTFVDAFVKRAAQVYGNR